MPILAARPFRRVSIRNPMRMPQMQQTNFCGTAFNVMRRLCGLLIPGNVAALRRTTAGLLIAGFAVIVFTQQAATTARAADPIIDAPAVDWSVARSVYQQAEQWVKDEEVKRKSSERPLLVSGVIGARVTLRYGGLTLGVGDAVSSSRPQEAQDLRELVAAATEIALQNFKEARDRTFNRTVRDQAEKEIREGKKPTVRPAPKPEPIPLVVDLQIGHAAIDVLVPDKASPQSVYFQFAAGYHGLRMRHHQKPESTAIQWPATALASNLLPDSQVKRLMADVGYQADEMLQLEPRVGRDKGPRLQRFEVIHITRASENQPITQLTRGNQVIPPQAIDMRTVESMGRRLTSHLVQRLLPDGSITGTYLPASDLFDPTKASDAEAALVALAMSRRVTLLGGRDPNGLDYLNTREKAFVLVDALRRRFSVQEAKEIDADAHALLLLAICDAPHLAELKDDRDRLASRLAAVPVEKGLFLNPRSRAPLPWESQGILLAAQAALYDKNRDEKLATAIEAGLEAVWSAKLSLAEAVAAMPWIMDATARMHRLANPADGKSAAAWKARATAAGELLSLLRNKRLVRGKPALGPDDVVGGYDLINETGEGVPTPDWRTSYVLTLLSQALQAPDVLAGENANLAKLDATLNVRLLGQLMFDEPSLYYIRGKGREAIDGVRFALWDNRLAVKPTAITLIAVTQLQQSLK